MTTTRNLTKRQKAALRRLVEAGGSMLWHQLAEPYHVMHNLEAAGLIAGETRPAGYRVTITSAGEAALAPQEEGKP